MVAILEKVDRLEKGTVEGSDGSGPGIGGRFPDTFAAETAGMVRTGKGSAAQRAERFPGQRDASETAPTKRIVHRFLAKELAAGDTQRWKTQRRQRGQDRSAPVRG